MTEPWSEDNLADIRWAAKDGLDGLEGERRWLATVDARDAEIERLRAIIDGAIIISRADIQAVKADLAHRFPLAIDVKEDALT